MNQDTARRALEFMVAYLEDRGEKSGRAYLFCKEALSSEAEEQKPIAWRWRWKGSGMQWSYNTSPMTDPAAECEPLFASASYVQPESK